MAPLFWPRGQRRLAHAACVLAAADGVTLTAIREAALCLKRGEVEEAGRLLDRVAR